MEPGQRPSPDAAALYSRAPCGLACTDDDGLFITVNETLCAWLGRDQESLVGKTRLQDLLTMGGRIFHQTHWSPLLRMQGSVSEVKLEVLAAGRKPVPMVLNAVRRETPGGFIHEVAMFVARDRDTYERELVVSRTKLQALVEETARLHAQARDRAVYAEQMMGIVSHDLRNPLSTIQMGVAVLSRAGANRDTVLARINRATERATRMIAELLDFTQARLGKGLAVSPAPMDLSACVRDAVDELSLVYPGRTISHSHTGMAACHGDGDRLAQLVGNLVSNAAAYGLESAPVEVISAVEAGTQGTMASIAVRNQGPPIDPALLVQLFEPMVRGNPDRSSRSVGLGLFIVREIARAHGGDVSVESTPQGVTTFTASFPAGIG